MKMREANNLARTEFASVTGVPPYLDIGIRARSGLKRTAFFPTISRFATDYKLHNTYLKPDFLTDPMEEYWALRKVCGLWDVTGEEVIEISGPDALALLNDLIPRDVSRMADGQCYYCVMCYDYGGIVEDAVLIRFSQDRFWWVGGPGGSEQWLYANALGRNVTVQSFLDRIHVASLQGPKSRELLQDVCDGDVTGLPFYGMIEAKVCGVPVVISRTGYTAELGYDIYVDIERAPGLFEDLWTMVRQAGGLLCGSRAMNIRRIEASILNYGHDFDWQHTPIEVGLSWMISEKKDYRAKSALLKAKAEGPSRRLAGLQFPGDEVPLTGDRVRYDGRDVGVVTSAIGSPSLGYPIAIAFLDSRAVMLGTPLTVDAGGHALEAKVVPMPFLDPERKLLKA